MSNTQNTPPLQHSQEMRRGAPGLAFPRVFSRAGSNIFDDVTWEYRDRPADEQVHSNGTPDRVEVPSGWTTEASLAFLRSRHDAESSTAPTSIRREMERLLTEVRGAALRGGYFSRVDDASLFTDEIGALLLSQRVHLLPGDDLPQGGESCWRWDGTRAAIVEEVPRAEVASNTAEARTASVQVVTLDDPELGALLAGRSAQATSSQALLLALPDELMRAADQDGDAAAKPGSESRSGATELLVCVAEFLLRRRGAGVIFADAVRRGSALAAASENAQTLLDAAAAAATMQAERFLTPGGQLPLSALRQAVALVTTLLEIQVDGRSYARKAAAFRAHQERGLAIALVGLEETLAAAGLQEDPAASASLSAALLALVCGEATWQTARMAETCPAVRAANLRPDDTTARAVSEGEGGACPAFTDHHECLLEHLRWQRSQAHGLVAASGTAATSEGVIPFRVANGEGQGRSEALNPLVAQLPEICAQVRQVWDGALLHGERFGLRNIGVTRMVSPADDRTVLSNSASGTSSTVQQRLRALAMSQPYFTSNAPMGLTIPAATSATDLAEWMLEAWRRGWKGVSLHITSYQGKTTARQESGRAHVSAVTGLAGETMEFGGTVTVMQEGAASTEQAGATESGKVDASEAGKLAAEHLPDARPAQTLGRPGPTPSRQSLGTLAEAEETAMRHEHASLVETQLHRISELEAQLKQVQAKARENGETYDAKEPPRAMRHRLPAERAAVTHKFIIAGHEGFITVGLYPNGSPGEIFLRMTKEGSAVAGLLDSFATSVSLALQHGVPVRVLAEQFAETRFEPAGPTANEQIPYALSIMDYLFRWIELRFLSGHQMDLFANLSPSAPISAVDARTVRVTGTVSGPASTVMPHLSPTRSRLAEQ